MIRFQSLTLARGTKPLFEAADLTLNPGEKAGLIGANGSGKSTLFAMLRNELHADGGEAGFPASWRIAHVAQETPALQRSALDYAIDGDTTLRKLEQELAEAEARLVGRVEARELGADVDLGVRIARIARVAQIGRALIQSMSARSGWMPATPPQASPRDSRNAAFSASPAIAGRPRQDLA